jgi:hypothetical protein
MADSTNNQPASKTPTHIAYHVRNREGGKGFWTRIRQQLGEWHHFPIAQDDKENSGIYAGRVLAQAITHHMMTNVDFLNDLNLAKQEIAFASHLRGEN